MVKVVCNSAFDKFVREQELVIFILERAVVGWVRHLTSVLGEPRSNPGMIDSFLSVILLL